MSARLRFLCPTCQAVMEAPLERAGHKIHCLKCGQRIQIPPPQHAKTILATPLGIVTEDEPDEPIATPDLIPATASAPRYYYLDKGQSAGPLALEPMQEKIAAHQILPDDLVWQEGTAQWVAAREVPELFANSPQPASSSPAPRFYYVSEGQSVGPLSLKEMQDMIASHRLNATDLVWQEGTPQWVAAAHVPELFAK